MQLLRHRILQSAEIKGENYISGSRGGKWRADPLCKDTPLGHQVSNYVSYTAVF